MRRKFIVGNWKMYTSRDSGPKLAAAIVQSLGKETRFDLAVCPPYPFLAQVAEAVRGSNVRLGAQNVYPEKEGAFTGEVSPSMLVDAGCQLVIVGHSERRHKLGETDEFISRKVHAALAAGLQVILCVGETLAQRQANETEKVLDRQITAGLTGIDAQTLSKMVVAYEPVWAIGTGHNATPQQAQEMHVFLRRRVAHLCSEAAAQTLVIQYGGSVKSDNAASLLSQPDVDGALVGGASLVAEQFAAIARAAVAG